MLGFLPYSATAHKFLQYFFSGSLFSHLPAEYVKVSITFFYKKQNPTNEEKVGYRDAEIRSIPNIFWLNKVYIRIHGWTEANKILDEEIRQFSRSQNSFFLKVDSVKFFK